MKQEYQRQLDGTVRQTVDECGGLMKAKNTLEKIEAIDCICKNYNLSKTQRNELILYAMAQWESEEAKKNRAHMVGLVEEIGITLRAVGCDIKTKIAKKNIF